MMHHRLTRLVALPGRGLIHLRNFSSSSQRHHLYREVDTAPLKNKLALCQPLKNRGLLRVSGEHAGMFLQGLITNDMRCLEVNCNIRAMYSFMLNVQGRVVNDLILYKPLQESSEPLFLVECEADMLPDLMSTLRKYKIRKKVDIADISAEQKVWAAFPKQVSQEPPEISITDKSSIISCCPDPRLKLLGHRLILPDGIPGSAAVVGASDCFDQDIYRAIRYQLGVGEGPVDFPPGSCFPLEANGVFLNGVSFEKGCYIGQELTARTHHTGVIRKRLMPITITSSKRDLQNGDSITNAKGKSCGKLRGVCKEHGLALLRVADVIKGGLLSVMQKVASGEDEALAVAEAEVSVPSWWPSESDEVIKAAMHKP